MFILSNMGKDHEFLEAARNGNITIVEKILAQKAKRTGPLASLRRGPGANVQDSSGYSALHHAALNGHSDVVRLLLAHDASPNLPDSRGSSPLHLAAWAGHQDIVKLFLTHPHRPANSNLQTIENETPLHCAAQHGHTGALTTLLAHGADPNVINSRSETPLDLAAQYGRLQAVQMLIRAHPELLLQFRASSASGGNGSISKCSATSCTETRVNEGSDGGSHYHHNQVVVSHSPLHLASRNGHKSVVEVLLAAGVNVNLLTPSGTALHEAALCGKDSVVRTLLDAGADLDATDCEGRTALDILEEFPPHVTKGIVSVINNHRNSVTYDSDLDDIRDNHNIHRNYITPMSLGSSYENNRGSPIQNFCNSHHDITTSPSSSIGSLGPPSPSPRPRASTSGSSEFYITMAPIKQRKSTAPKKPPRRNLSISPTHPQPQSNSMSISVDNSSDNQQYHWQQPYNSGGKGSQKPVNYEYIFMARTGKSRDEDRQNRVHSVDQYVEMNSPRAAPRSFISATPSYENTGLKSYNPNRKLKRNRDNYEQFSIDFNKDKKNNDSNGAIIPAGRDGSKHKDDESKSIGIISDSKVATDIQVQMPQSPTNYQQPPTPEHPPPSALHAEKFIHDRIRPLSQEYKRRSGVHQEFNVMMESSTSPPPVSYSTSAHQLQQRLKTGGCSLIGDSLCQSLATSSGSLTSSISISDRSVSTDCVEEYIGDVPFAGLFKGSTMTLNNAPYYSKHNQQHQNIERPKTLYTQQQSQSPSASRNATDIDSKDDDHFHFKSNQQTRRQKYLNTKEYSVTVRDKFDEISNQNSDKDSQTIDNLNCRDGFIGIANNRLHQRGKLIKSKTVTSAGISESDVLSPFDEQEAWAKISEIMESFGSGILSVNDMVINCDDDIKEIIDKNNKQLNIWKTKNKEHLGYDENGGGLGSSDEGLSTTNHTADTKINRPIKNSTSSHSATTKTPLGILLKENNLGHLEKILIDNGFDHTDFLNGVLDENDLKMMNIPECDQKLLMELISKLPVAQSLPICNTNATNNNNTSMNIDDWLQGINLGEYIEVFRRHLYTDMERVFRVWEVELQTVLEITKFGHRKRILYTVAKNRIPPISVPSIDKLTSDRMAIKPNVMQPLDDFNEVKNQSSQSSVQNSMRNLKGNQASEILSALPSQTASGGNGGDSNSGGISINTLTVTITGGQSGIRHSNKKNRPAPKPPVRMSSLEIRAPSELLLGLPSNLRTQWRHSANTLVSNFVNYDVYYLGSTVVKELRGTESTRKSIQKLKRDDRIALSTVNVNQSKENGNIRSDTSNPIRNQPPLVYPAKKQPVRLSISHRGVEFIDIDSQTTICEHEIRNINCACQDADDLSHFAYITKDSDMNTHYCHVFNVDSMDLATEIILTLGQAFEVAYQLALREASLKTSLSGPTICN